MFKTIAILFLIFGLSVPVYAQSQSPLPPYKDSTLTTEERVQDLLDRCFTGYLGI